MAECTVHTRIEHIKYKELLIATAAILVLTMACDDPNTTAPDPPSGGQKLVLDYDMFVSEVAPILTAEGCDIVACHGGGFRGTFMLSPSTDKDVDLDFAQARLQVNGIDPVVSPLLAKPLAPTAGGAAHAADPEVYGFTSATDANYLTILSWIESGEYR